jgi:hypothetical protein
MGRVVTWRKILQLVQLSKLDINQRDTVTQARQPKVSNHKKHSANASTVVPANKVQYCIDFAVVNVQVRQLGQSCQCRLMISNTPSTYERRDSVCTCTVHTHSQQTTQKYECKHNQGSLVLHRRGSGERRKPPCGDQKCKARTCKYVNGAMVS